LVVLTYHQGDEGADSPNKSQHPRDLHRRLQETAARQGCSARQLLLASIRNAVDGNSPRGKKKPLKLHPPIVSSRGKPFDLTNEQIHELIELP
jgi:hypothetical protein